MSLFSAQNFHLPQDLSVPLILIGPGTGIAPFRGFWHHRRAQLNSRTRHNAGPVWLFFGCRTKTMDLYREEKEHALKDGVLSKVFLALSREKNIPKVIRINSYVFVWICIWLFRVINVTILLNLTNCILELDTKFRLMILKINAQNFLIL